MTNSENSLYAELDRSAASCSDAPQHLSGMNGSAKWDVDVNKIESLGCQVSEVSVSQADSKSSSGDIAKRVCERVNYLSEPIRVLEVDGEHDQAIARSSKVTDTDEGGGYFELNVSGQGMSWKRYVAKRGEPRSNVDFCVTRETLGRLIEDSAAALNPEP